MKEINKNFQNHQNQNYNAVNDLMLLEIGLPKYNSHIAKIISDEIVVKKNLRILDFGAGKGTLTKLIQKNINLKVYCLEIDSSLRQELKNKGFNILKSNAREEKYFDVVYSSNVLEHIENDNLALKKINSMLKKDGLFIAYVPAFKLLYSDFDFRIGHYRRYSKKTLKSVFEENGFSILKINFVDSLGFLAALIFKFRSKLTHKSTINPYFLVIYDTYLFPLAKIFDYVVFHKILGKNLFIVGKKII
jgi:SAM-dependent methyltransferase